MNDLTKADANVKTNEASVRRLTWALVAGISAVSLMVGLSLLLSRFQVLAQPTVETMDLLAQKEVNTTLAAPGDILTYTITIRNSNPPAGTIWLTDTLPDELVYITNSLTSDIWEGSWGVENNVITWTGQMYGNNSTVAITFSARISTGLLYTEIENTAQITGTGQLIGVASETTTVVAEIGNLDNPNTHKTVTPPGYAEQGQMLTYTITLNNDESAPVPELHVVDEIPPDLILITSSITHSRGSHITQDGVITWTLDMEGGPNITETLSLRARIPPNISYDGWIINTAEIMVAGSSFTRTVGTYVQRTSPSLTATKSVYPNQARPGQYLTYTVHITNTGDRDAETVRMTDTLPSLVTYVTGTTTMGTFGVAGGVITWNATLGPAGTLLLPDGEQAAITFTVQISPELTQDILFTNTAEITGAGSLVVVQVPATVLYRFYIYMPIILKRWPPIPYAPVLYDIDDPAPGSNDYTVRWSHDHSDITVDNYTLQEATNQQFTQGVQNYTIPHTGTENEKSFTDKPDGTYYYRVQGHNEYGTGAWSNVESVAIFTIYYDDFNDSNSGWPNEKREIKDDQGEVHGYWHRRYRDGQYRIYIEQPTCWTCGWFYQPDALAPFRPPTDKYCIETEVKFEDGAYWANMGVVIGADEANRKIYALCYARGGDEEKLGWFLMRKDDYHLPMRGCSGPTAKIANVVRENDSSRYGWNRVKIGVDGDNVTVYMSGNYKGQWTMSGLSDMTRVGVIGGNYEILPVDIRYSHFKVLPNSDCQ